ncbi:uncharacterized protein FTJAE_3043 [Fusarium tjaetaba]|uniref:Uncharacterized protein n=1 Tax=Fusarium tjaetaba TaxID=1567544 RepID=A0A8H5W327_9HYPO|nr:uncharacterized protein FTJAE_3043 [Fusarium tjaetaba]KAF5643745.1 hypothetical protein FTJAE_3043 [Fusarium tjaetaba]
MSQQIGNSEPASQLGHSQPSSSSANRTRRRRQDSRHMPYARNSHDHPSRPGPNRAAFRPQDSTMASDRQPTRQGPSPAIIPCRNLAPVDLHPPSSPEDQDDRHREPSRVSHVNRGLETDQHGTAHIDLPPTYNEAVSQSREHAQREPSVRPGFHAPTEAISGQGRATDGIRHLRQENADLRKKLDDNTRDLQRQINNLKMEQVFAITALRDATTEQARTIAYLKEVTTEQAHLIDDLKARLETRETDGPRFS